MPPLCVLDAPPMLDAPDPVEADELPAPKEDATAVEEWVPPLLAASDAAAAVELLLAADALPLAELDPWMDCPELPCPEPLAALLADDAFADDALEDVALADDAVDVELWSPELPAPELAALWLEPAGALLDWPLPPLPPLLEPEVPLPPGEEQATSVNVIPQNNHSRVFMARAFS